MFNLEQAIARWRQQMRTTGLKPREVLEELESHLRDDIEEQVRSGIDPQQAFAVAVERVGEAGALKAEFQKLPNRTLPVRRLLKEIITRFVTRPIPLPSLNDFDPNARHVLELAREEPARFNHDFVGTEHVLLGVLRSKHEVVSKVLRRFGVERDAVSVEIEKFVGLGPVHEANPAIPFTPRARKALQLAASEAKAMNRARVGTEHIFLGLLSEGSGVAALVLKNLGIETQRTREEILKEIDPNLSGD